jgi:hypothetical protein
VYTGAFTVPTSPLTLTQSSGTNISAITGTSTFALLLQKDLNDASTGIGILNFTSLSYPGQHVNSPFLLSSSLVSLLFHQNPTQTDNGLYNFTATNNGGASMIVDKASSPFNSGVSVFNARGSAGTVDSGLNLQSAASISTSGGVYSTNLVSPFGNTTGTALLVAQTSNIAFDAGIDSSLNVFTGSGNPANVKIGPFNNDTVLLTLQDSIIQDIGNFKASMVVNNTAPSLTDASPFTLSSSFTSLLVNHGYIDSSFANATIANSANIATVNTTYNPFTIPSSLVSVLGMQTSNLTLESSINNATFTTLNTAPTISSSSPFGTYNSNGIIYLTTSGTTGIPGNKTNYANLLVTAGDGVTTNAYSINITAVGASGNLGTTQSISNENVYSNLAPSLVSLVDVGNILTAETTANIFVGSSQASANTFKTYITNIGYDINSGNLVITAPSNTTPFISDVQNSNLGETLQNILVSNVKTNIELATDKGITNLGLTTSLFISDVQNSNLSETLANTYFANLLSFLSYEGSLQGTNIKMPSPVGGTVLFPTYSYTDGVPITAANVQSGGGTSFASNTQIWYQT